MNKTKIHVSLPVSTLERADKMTADDAGPHEADRSRWLADLIETRWDRREVEDYLRRQPLAMALIRKIATANLTDAELSYMHSKVEEARVAPRAAKRRSAAA